jgi:hypothetical protein
MDDLDKIRRAIQRRALASPLRLDNEPICTIKEAAAWLNCSYDTASRWAKSGDFSYEVGGLRLVKVCELVRKTAETKNRKVSAA